LIRPRSFYESLRTGDLRSPVGTNGSLDVSSLEASRQRCVVPPQRRSCRCAGAGRQGVSKIPLETKDPDEAYRKHAVEHVCVLQEQAAFVGATPRSQPHPLPSWMPTPSSGLGSLLRPSSGRGRGTAH
jgi:hypothetical protein